MQRAWLERPAAKRQERETMSERAQCSERGPSGPPRSGKSGKQ
jgi:hypothetical protein